MVRAFFMSLRIRYYSMKNFIVICFLSIFFFTSVSAQETLYNVTLEVSVPDSDTSKAIYVAGNHKELGEWNPAKIAFTKKSSLWTVTIQVPEDTPLEYKFTRGSWASEAVDSLGRTPGNNHLLVLSDTTVHHGISHWKDQFEQTAPAFLGQITGNVDYYSAMKGDSLLPRDVFVWLPPNYNDDQERRYPVLYMHDAQNLIDPKTSLFGIDWQIDETADSLIRKGIIEPFILVGINNSSDRSLDYSPDHKGHYYAAFLIDSLKPFIDAKYRTLPDRENTAVGGSSMGGLISFMLTYHYSDVFSKAACFSPALKIDKYDYVKHVESDSSGKKDILLYLDNGGLGLEKMLQPGIDEMIRLLIEKGYDSRKDFYWFRDPEAEHNEAAWAERIYKPLILFYGIK